MSNSSNCKNNQFKLGPHQKKFLLNLSIYYKVIKLLLGRPLVMLELNHVKSFLNLCIFYTNIEIKYHKKRDPNFLISRCTCNWLKIMASSYLKIRILSIYLTSSRIRKLNFSVKTTTFGFIIKTVDGKFLILTVYLTLAKSIYI